MNRRKKGTVYEEIAALYLKEKEINIIKKNYRIRQGEVDLIGEDTSHLIFFEVKFRSSNQYGEPVLSVTKDKMRRISKVAEYFLMRYPTDKQVRYDIISICGEEIIWYKNAFYHIGY